MSKENTARNTRTRAERHGSRMLAQSIRVALTKVPRGTARNERRKPLQLAYAERMVNAAE